jgi:hypothetical protein
LASNKQSGFSAVIGIIAIVLVVGITVFIGWRLYSQSKQANSSSSTTQNTTRTPVSRNNQNATPPQQTDPNAGYFVIKEWGVRFKAASELNGLEYALRFNDSMAVFSTPSITAVDTRCGIQGADDDGIDSVSRYATNAQQPATEAWYITTINGYNYYFGGSGGADCVSNANDTAGQNLRQMQQSSFSSSIKSLEEEQPIDPYAGWKTFCSVNGGICFRYPTDWQEAETAKDDKTGADYITVTSPSGAILVNYIPIVMGIGGGCPSGCYFKAESMNQYATPNTLGLEVIKGVFTYKDNPSVAADYFLASSDQMARYKLQLNQSVEVGTMYTGPKNLNTERGRNKIYSTA